MNTIKNEFQKLVELFLDVEFVAAGKIFGKPCLKVRRKAFAAQHKNMMVFKLSKLHREKALTISGSSLWDPSGKGFPMKEWVAIPAEKNVHFDSFAKLALSYVSSSS